MAQLANARMPPRVAAVRSGGSATHGPFQELPSQASNWSAGLLQRLGLPNVLLEAVPQQPPEYYCCPFRVSKLPR